VAYYTRVVLRVHEVDGYVRINGGERVNCNTRHHGSFHTTALTYYKIKCVFIIKRDEQHILAHKSVLSQSFVVS